MDKPNLSRAMLKMLYITHKITQGKVKDEDHSAGGRGGEPEGQRCLSFLVAYAATRVLKAPRNMETAMALGPSVL